jgi:hypothetical protein
MKLVIHYEGQVKIFDLVQDPEVYFQGGDMHPGYKLKDEDDFIIADGEYLALHLAMSLYEGSEVAGSYVDWTAGKLQWSWALLPETEADNEHLRRFAGRTMYRGIPG